MPIPAHWLCPVLAPLIQLLRFYLQASTLFAQLLVRRITVLL